MGIKDFKKYILSIEKNIFQDIDISQLSGKRFAIDISIYLYKYICTAQQYETNWFDMIIKFILKLKRLNVYLIVIFDGTPPKEKLETLKARRENKFEKKINAENIEKLLKTIDLKSVINEVEKILKINNASDYTHDELHKMCTIKYGKMNSQNVNITAEHINMLKTFLTFMGIPWFVATGEAERTCAWLAKHFFVSAVISEDTDVLCFGAPVMIKSFTNVNKAVTKIKLKSVKKALKLSDAQLVDFCILCGTDYNDRIPGIGPSKAHALFSSTQTLDTISVKLPIIRENIDINVIRDLFMVPNVDEIEKVIDISLDYNINIMPRSNMDEMSTVLQNCNSELTVEQLSNSIGWANFIIK